MKSTLKMAIDWDKRQPVIKLVVAQDRSDVRDQTCGAFVELLGHTSSFCIIECTGVGTLIPYNKSMVMEEPAVEYTISAVAPSELRELRDRIDALIKEAESK